MNLNPLRTKPVRVTLIILLYPVGMLVGIYQSLARWFSNLDFSEVHTAHTHWKEMCHEMMHPGYLAWQHRRNVARMCNMPFDEKEP